MFMPQPQTQQKGTSDFVTNTPIGNPNIMPNMYFDPRMLYQPQMMYPYGYNNQVPNMNYPTQNGILFYLFSRENYSSKFKC
jgi:hypothetical protein